ncbi:NAD(P)/FAD-dependent oxidoreductase [Mycobacterium sp. MAA66]|uniref:NAD(P)/FAD-dependent oxidoreductase n=1 Tax=Mycobacterium sp. MAA66 TaxID=3156297 RepID=UPI0035141630
MIQDNTAPVVIIGGGLAGSRTCTELRQLGFSGPIVLVCDEPGLPYDRPPLSKNVIRGKRESKPLKVRYEELSIDVRLGVTAKALDLDSRQVQTSDGPIEFGHLVIATGATPVRLPGSGEQLTLRTDTEAAALRDRLTEGARVVVIGASWIGAEVAHVAVERGCRVTGLEYHRAPLAQALGTEIGSRFASWWSGAELRTGARVVAVEDEGVQLADGEVIPADVVVTGIGVRATTDWLADSGLELLPALAVDEYLRCTAARDVYAVGDAAAWWSRRYDRRLNVQHWDDAYCAPAVVAAGIYHGADSQLIHDPVPYFWSDQFGHRIEYVGHHDGSDTVTIDEDHEKGWTAQWFDGSGRVTAALSVDQSKFIAATRTELLARSGG